MSSWYETGEILGESMPNSERPVTQGQLTGITNDVLDTTPTSGSTNGVQSGGVFSALAAKASLASPVFTGTVTMPAETITGVVEQTQGSTLTFYNTLDQTVNYERVRKFWTANTYTVQAEQGGTGATRAIVHNVGTAKFTIQSGPPAGTGFFNFDRTTSGVNTILNVAGSYTSSSNMANAMAIITTINQSSTAGYRTFWISPFELATGSGNKLLMDVGTNSATGGTGTHTSKFSVDNVGNGTFLGTMKTSQLKLSALNAAPASATDTGTLGEIRVTAGFLYVCTATNTWVRVALSTW
jgi:hypothetical protein